MSRDLRCADTLGVADPDRLVEVRARELDEWGRLVGRLDQAGGTAGFDRNRSFAGSPNRDGMACFGEYIAALLDADRGRP